MTKRSFSEVQYKKKIKKWNLEKNLNKTTVLAMLRIKDKRKLAGKLTRFKHKRRPVGEDKLEHSRKRLGVISYKEVLEAPAGKFKRPASP